MQTHTKTYLANDVGGLRNLTRQVERSTPPQRLHYANCHLQMRKMFIYFIKEIFLNDFVLIHRKLNLGAQSFTYSSLDGVL